MGSLPPSLSSQLILPFMECFGDCLNHGFSLIKRITGSLSRSLSSRLILLLSKIELISRQLWILIRLTRHQQVANRGWDLYGRTEAITI